MRRGVFKVIHAENARVRKSLSLVERKATPGFLMRLGIQLHLAGLSLSSTVSILDIFGVERTCSTVHSWVHKADLQPAGGQSQDQVAVDETVF